MKVSCLCAKTVFEAELKNHDVHACHCSMCRQQSSGVLMSIDIEPDSLRFEDQAYLSLFKSSEWGERGFSATAEQCCFGVRRTAVIAILMSLRCRSRRRI